MPAYEDIVRQLQQRDPLPPLYPTRAFDGELSTLLTAASDEELFGTAPADRAMANACRAGLLQWNDDLDRSHTLAQDLHDATGSFWHAIMHRREGDAGNSHYWWRKTGAHPAFGDVYRAALAALEAETFPEAREFAQVLERAGTWVPMEFVGRCELARRGQLASEWLQRVQVAEFQALLGWCHDQMKL